VVRELVPSAVIIRPPVVYGPRDFGLYDMYRTVAKGLRPEIGGRKILSIIHARDLAEGRIFPGPQRLRYLAAYYRAHLGLGPFPPVECNAPWTSVVIEANGALRPCFFHAPVGNLRQRSLDDLLNLAMPAFRKQLNVAADATCQRCVCTLKTNLRAQLW